MRFNQNSVDETKRQFTTLCRGISNRVIVNLMVSIHVMTGGIFILIEEKT